MSNDLLSARDAARRLGVTIAAFYDWLGQSDRGLFVIRGDKVTVEYFQGGPKGQGKILIEHAEVERIKELMRVRPQPVRARRPPAANHDYPGITVPLGRPAA